jgi:hypothetical protein
MNIKKIVCTIIVIAVYVFSLAGCYAENFISSDIEGDKLAKELLGYLSENDAEGVKSMFCDQTKESPDLDQQIEDALEFFEGKVITDDPMILVGSEEAMEKGRVTWLNVSPSIEEIETNAGKTYKILFYSYLVCAENEEIVGVSEIDIYSADGEVCTIGEYIE